MSGPLKLQAGHNKGINFKTDNIYLSAQSLPRFTQVFSRPLILKTLNLWKAVVPITAVLTVATEPVFLWQQSHLWSSLFSLPFHLILKGYHLATGPQ